MNSMTRGLLRGLKCYVLSISSEERGIEDLKDFRSISLIGGLYKPLARVLAYRLKKVVGSLVSDFQHAFVVGRQILDVMLIENEATNSRIKDKERNLM